VCYFDTLLLLLLLDLHHDMTAGRLASPVQTCKT
jgi:hypothetical protein